MGKGSVAVENETRGKCGGVACFTSAISYGSSGTEQSDRNGSGLDFRIGKERVKPVINCNSRIFLRENNG